MARFPKILRRARKDEKGATIIEFALIAPVFLFMLLGTFEIGYGIYMRSALNGAIQFAARSATLQDAADPDVRREIDDKVRDILKTVNGNLSDSDILITRKSYLNYSNVERIEAFTDTNLNGRCDNNEVYVDENGNGSWGAVGRADNGSARDAVLYNISVTYGTMFPFDTFTQTARNTAASYKLEGFKNTRTIKSATLLKNQPFGEQASRGAGSNRNCNGTAETENYYQEVYSGGGVAG